VTRPEGVKSLILSNSAASTWRWIAEANRLRADLPEEVQNILQVHEAAGTTDDPDYAAAMEVFYQRHLCRKSPVPDFLNQMLERLAQNSEVYASMWGPSEFHCTGVLMNWDIEQQLGEIHTPTLILSGRYDESTPAINAVLKEKLPDAEWVIFEESSHTPHLEETERYLQVVADFLARGENETQSK